MLEAQKRDTVLRSDALSEVTGSTTIVGKILQLDDETVLFRHPVMELLRWTRVKETIDPLDL